MAIANRAIVAEREVLVKLFTIVSPVGYASVIAWDWRGDRSVTKIETVAALQLKIKNLETQFVLDYLNSYSNSKFRIERSPAIC